MKPQDAVDLYIQWLDKRSMAHTTKDGASRVLARFVQYCRMHKIRDVRNVTEKTLLDYHGHVKRLKRKDGRVYNLNYQNTHVMHARLLFRMLYDRKLILGDITTDLPPLKEPDHLPKNILSKDEVMALLQQPFITTLLGFRDRTMFEVIYSCGLRSGELCNLTLYDVDVSARMIKVRKGKGKKDRVVPIGKVACGYLAEYIKSVRPVLLDERKNDMLFLTGRGGRVFKQDLWRLIKFYCRTAGLPDTTTVHSLRHSCATEMLKGGASLRHVQELLGHTNITTTQIYTRIVPADLQKAHQRSAPSERRKQIEDIPFDNDGCRWESQRRSKKAGKKKKKQ